MRWFIGSALLAFAATGCASNGMRMLLVLVLLTGGCAKAGVVMPPPVAPHLGLVAQEPGKATRVTVYTQTPQGAPLAGVFMTVADERGRVWLTSDDDGLLTFSLVPGYTWLIAHYDGQSLEQRLELPPGSETVLVVTIDPRYDRCAGDPFGCQNDCMFTGMGCGHIVRKPPIIDGRSAATPAKRDRRALRSLPSWR